VYASEPSKSTGGCADAFEIGHFNLFCIPNHNVFDLSVSVYQDAYLSARIMRYFGELSCQFLGNNLLGVNTTTIKPLDAFDLVLF